MAAKPSSPEDLGRRALKRRAVEAVFWGMPAVNYDLMFQALRKLGGAQNQVVYWSKLLDWKNQTLTPNPDAIYVMPFFDTREAGPMVLEIPPADGGVINGSVMDCWQTPFEDVGPAGLDQGKGGKYLVLPPGHTEEIPAGYIPLRSQNHQGYALLRSILEGGSPEQFEKALDYARRIQLYPLSQAASPDTTWVDAAGKMFNATIPYDVRFFESLDRMVQAEPWLERDRAMIDQLATVGILKGRRFRPAKGTASVLRKAATQARAEMEVLYERAYETPFYPRTHWAVPAPHFVIEAMGSGFADPDSYPVEWRGTLYSFIFFCAKHLGAGQFYVMAIADRRGRPLDGGKTWRLTVPADAPITQYWSATAYDRKTHSLYRGKSPSSRSSQNAGLKVNKNGSVDIYFGPKAPRGMKSNWVPTRAGTEFEVLFRLYGPTKAFFDRKWRLPDIEKA